MPRSRRRVPSLTVEEALRTAASRLALLVAVFESVATSSPGDTGDAMSSDAWGAAAEICVQAKHQLDAVRTALLAEALNRLVGR